jgi:hypothetical protein
MELMLFTLCYINNINTERKQLKQVLHFRFSFEPRFSEVNKSLSGLSFSLRSSVLRHVMYTIVDRYYMTMKERLGASLAICMGLDYVNLTAMICGILSLYCTYVFRVHVSQKKTKFGNLQ